MEPPEKNEAAIPSLSSNRIYFHIETLDNGYIINHGQTRRLCTNLFQVAKWIRSKAVEEKNEANKKVPAQN